MIYLYEYLEMVTDAFPNLQTPLLTVPAVGTVGEC